MAIRISTRRVADLYLPGFPSGFCWVLTDEQFAQALAKMAVCDLVLKDEVYEAHASIEVRAAIEALRSVSDHGE